VILPILRELICIRSSEQDICQAVWKLSDACSLTSFSSLDPSRVSPSHVVSRLGYCARELAGGLHDIWCRINYVNFFCLESTLLVWHVVLSSLERSLPDFDTGCHGFIVRAKVFVLRTKLFLTDTLSTVFGRAFSTVHTRDLYQPLRGRYKTLKRIQVLLGNVSNTLDPVT